MIIGSDRCPGDFIRRIKPGLFLQVLPELVIFLSITLVIHLVWNFWEDYLDFKPIDHLMENINQWMVSKLVKETVWVLNFWGDKAFMAGRKIVFFQGSSLTIFEGCSGVKQFMQFVLLMFFYPGPVMKKIWFVPLGVIVIHGINLIRLIGLSMVLLYWSQTWTFFHDWLFKVIFYAGIFILWVIWNEYLRES